VTDLLDVLGEAQARGLLGPGPVAEQVRHSRVLAGLVGAPPESLLDLGSGAGIPGLVLALDWPASPVVLLDSHRRACTYLDEAVERLELGRRVRVACGRAEELARKPDLRAAFDLVVARSFGPPAVTAECAVGFLRPGGRLAVSDPPREEPGRWSAVGLEQLGLSGPTIRKAEGATVAVMEATEPAADRWPRRPGIPAKRPLW
jgi:16S rRNA (guanine527-N7)-methyltransferase